MLFIALAASLCGAKTCVEYADFAAANEAELSEIALGRIEAERRCGAKVETSTRYVALSTLLSPARLLEVVRAHWSVENNLHWQLDVSFHEDQARIRKDYAPYNLTIIRRMALDILRAHPDKRSIARKMNLARWKKSFFYELFAHMR
jgi:predicted transposase YbfD/YdcC